MTVRHLHASGKWSARPRTFARYIAECAERTDATRLTTTESRGKGTAVRRALGKRKWDLVRRGEFLIAVRRDTGELGNGWLTPVSNEFHGPLDWRDQQVHWSWVRGVGGTELVGATHFSSAVQNGAHWSGFAPGVAAHQSGSSNIGATVARNRRRGIDVSLGADGNQDYHLARWREYMRDEMGMAGCWDRDRPSGGTHGRRLIDGVWSTMPTRSARIVGVDPPGVLDHDAVFAVLGGRADVSLTPLRGDR